MKYGAVALINGSGSKRGLWNGNPIVDAQGWDAFAKYHADLCIAFGVDKDAGLIERNPAGSHDYMGMRFTQWTDRFSGGELREQTIAYVRAHEAFVKRTGFFPKIYLGRLSENPDLANYSRSMLLAVVLQAVAPFLPFARAGLPVWIIIDASAWTSDSSFTAILADILEELGFLVGYEAWPPVGGWWQNTGNRFCFMQSDNSSGDGKGGYARQLKMNDSQRATSGGLAARDNVGPELHVFIEQQNAPKPAEVVKWDCDAVYMPLDASGKYMNCTAGDFRRIAGSVK